MNSGGHPENENGGEASLAGHRFAAVPSDQPLGRLSVTDPSYSDAMAGVQLAMTTTSAQTTMSSLEIAELTGKRHDNVIRDIKAMLTDLKTEGSDFAGAYKDVTGRSLVCFNLPKRESLILVSGYSTELRARIIDRWQELERQIPAVRADAMAALSDPATMRHLLLGYTEKVLFLEAANQELGGKAAALDLIAEAEGSLCITDAAKALQMPPKDLFRWLYAHGWIYRRNGNKNWLGYQPKQRAGLLVHKVDTAVAADGTERIAEQVRVTAKGLAKLAEIIGVELQRAA